MFVGELIVNFYLFVFISGTNAGQGAEFQVSQGMQKLLETASPFFNSVVMRQRRIRL